MNKFVRFYNQNRGLCITVVVICAIIIIVIHILNDIIEKNNLAKEENRNSSTNSTTISPSNVSVITGEEVKGNVQDTEVIKRFVEYCNEGDIDKAYDMLTDECKQLLFQSVEQFKANYVDKIFYKNRLYTLQNWYTSNQGNTYYIKYIEDILATGDIKSSDNKSDYITVINTSDSAKLNINNYVRSKEINKSADIKKGVTIKIDKIYMYIDYTVMSLSLVNNINETIAIDTMEETDNIYLYDENDVKYTAMLNENGSQDLILEPYIKKNIKIKFNKMYNTKSSQILGIKIDEIVTNYSDYLSGNGNKNIQKIDIKF